jgi:biopolymer transport protein ExbB
MNAARELFANGGPAFVAIMALSVFLYERCFHLLLFLRRTRRGFAARAAAAPAGLPAIRWQQQELRDTFRQQRVAIGAMIAAAPLLGLLGTVMGMIAAFDSLGARGATQSMEGLAQGISEVLIDTESGLAVAIPAVLLLYLAHRQMEKAVHKLTALEARIRETA